MNWASLGLLGSLMGVFVGVGTTIYFSNRQYQQAVRLANDLYQARLVIIAIPDEMLEEVRTSLVFWAVDPDLTPEVRQGRLEVLAAVSAELEHRQEG